MVAQRVIATQPTTQTSVSAGSSSNGFLIESFVESRAFEVTALKQAMKSSRLAGSKRTFQILPRHLRRRAASHNPNRVPRRLRARAIGEVRNNVVWPRDISTTPPLSTNVRRNMPSRLRFMRRQRDKRWLETHVWHAKRAHMENLWGCRVATSKTEKALRSTYRVGRKKALIHDASYQSIIQLTGDGDSIGRVLDLMVDPNLTRPSAARYRKGTVQCTTWLYTPGAYPQGRLCPTTILWEANPEVEGERGHNRRAWLLVHPSVWDSVWISLEKEVEKIQKGKLWIQVDWLIIPLLLLMMQDLRGEMNVYEFTGPHSLAHLHAVLDPVASDAHPGNATWRQLAGVRLTSNLPPGCILSLSIPDPRIRFPPPKPDLGQAKNDLTDLPILTKTWGPEVAISSIWDEEKRSALSKDKPSEVAIQSRKEVLIPGDVEILRESDSIHRIPLLLFQRTGTSLPAPSSRLPRWCHGGLREQVDEGITLLVPKDWGFPFWHSFIFTGIRFIGLKERTSMQYESGLPTYPDDYPECPSFPSLIRNIRREGQKLWEGMPPAKRINYAHHGITHPPWDLDWAILRGPKPSSSVTPWVLSSTQLLDLVERGPNIDASQWVRVIQGSSKAPASMNRVIPCLNEAIVRVRLSLRGRGTLEWLGLNIIRVSVLSYYVPF
ncbi:ribonucleases P/MRP protein subunit POP1-domain-containing protein [Piptocephalis cylindrospora]|uniref:Ribonucleases P/MRP protein subunit POP1-domain-containing protein n=1 Tax=Piptocephalis cylindrospora TaxID=1907219 RepID=A0A4P9Y7V7_9FUNG|nr:ribonucleases P/MRP protein subunit POP1-domain-containing protein [Piptocephalis cylindrospora]|eukprot:RKP14030.1 ribonucleases P/MRP protein subunit POP1-domain-containing protein [Piptocephalis cylindrospora]